MWQNESGWSTPTLNAVSEKLSGGSIYLSNRSIYYNLTKQAARITMRVSGLYRIILSASHDPRNPMEISGGYDKIFAPAVLYEEAGGNREEKEITVEIPPDCAQIRFAARGLGGATLHGYEIEETDGGGSVTPVTFEQLAAERFGDTSKVGQHLLVHGVLSQEELVQKVGLNGKGEAVFPKYVANGRVYDDLERIPAEDLVYVLPEPNETVRLAAVFKENVTSRDKLVQEMSAALELGVEGYMKLKHLQDKDLQVAEYLTDLDYRMILMEMGLN